eukprot:UN27098
MTSFCKGKRSFKRPFIKKRSSLRGLFFCKRFFKRPFSLT